MPIIFTLILLTTDGTSGQASEPVQSVEPIPERVSEASYSAEVIRMDVIGLGLFVAAALGAGIGSAAGAGGSELGEGVVWAALAAGAGVWTFGGPIVHLVHDSPGRAVSSLLLRVGLPVATAFLGAYSLSSGSDAGDASVIAHGVGFALGWVAGGLTAWGIDWFVLADSEPSSAGETEQASWNLSPVVAATDGGAYGGVLMSW